MANWSGSPYPNAYALGPEGADKTKTIAWDSAADKKPQINAVTDDFVSLKGKAHLTTYTVIAKDNDTTPGWPVTSTSNPLWEVMITREIGAGTEQCIKTYNAKDLDDHPETMFTYLDEFMPWREDVAVVYRLYPLDFFGHHPAFPSDIVTTGDTTPPSVADDIPIAGLDVISAQNGIKIKWSDMIRDGERVGAVTPTNWAANTAYSLLAVVKAVASPNNYLYECTTAGTSGSTEPSWPTVIGSTVTDGSVVWTCHRPVEERWIKTYQIQASESNTFASGILTIYTGLATEFIWTPAIADIYDTFYFRGRALLKQDVAM